MRLHSCAAVLVLAAASFWLGGQTAEAGPARSLTVLVVTQDTGEPISGADVRARAGAASGITEWPQRTDAQGTAQIEGLDVERVGLRVTARGYVGVNVDAVILADLKGALRVPLALGTAVDGVVLDEAGRPVHGAEVEALAGGRFRDQREAMPNGPSFATVYTSEDGRFEIPGIPRDGISTVIVRARGYAQGRVAVRADKGDVEPEALEFRLAAGGRVRGRVLDPDGKAVMGAMVYVIADGSLALQGDPRSATPGSARDQTYLDAQETDGKGRFAVDGLGLGRAYVVRAYHEGFSSSEWVGPISVQRPGEKATVDLALRPPLGGDGEPESAPAVSQHVLDELVAAVKDEDTEGRLRIEAAVRLGKIKSGGVRALVPLLERGDPATKLYALCGIGEGGPDAAEAVPALVKALKDEIAEVRALAIGALGQIGPPAQAALPALEALAQQGSENAKRALEKIRAQ
ncbi:MAG: carboxypeptidase regulatory-like domain-containing protein [Planctomycetes bacterium]|nr:carboxypeptidase regulatory-like domain-containing protein [Planctomycetota bacterium]MCB9900054.1 carboxypeptidase regulatory-like domain-containing protein [Planctomycetota bacterium]